MATKPGHHNRNYPLKSGGPPAPINERVRRRLIMSEVYKSMRGQGTPMDCIERSLERSALNTNEKTT